MSEATAARVALDRPIPAELRAEVTEKLAYASESLGSFAIDPEGRHVDFTVVGGGSAEEVGAKVRRLVDGLVKGHRAVDKHILYSHRVTPPHGEPVWDALVERGHVFAEGPGQVSLLGDAFRVAEALDRRLATIFRDELGAEEHQYPTMLSMAALDRCHYFATFPHHVTFAPHLREDVEVLGEVGRAREHGEGYPFLEHLRPPRHVLSPALCFHTYLAFADRPLAGPRVVTTKGRCFRYEARNFATLERVWDFSMREVIFLGSTELVTAQREKVVGITRRLVEELGLDAWIETANDPFFVNDAVTRRYFQLVAQTKYELRLALPEGRSVAAASFNLHNDFFAKSFGITSAGGAPAATACVGFGFERWVWALFSQLGPDLAGWPARARRAIGL